MLDNTTRWSSKFQMLKRYAELQEHIENIVPVQLQLSPVAKSELAALLKKLGQLAILTKFVQSEDRQLHGVREAFEKSIQIFDCLADHCSAFSDIVCDPIFESAVCKIQRHQVVNDTLKLSPQESKTVKHLNI